MSPRLPVTTPNDAPDGTKPILNELKQALGMVPNLYAVIGNSPGSLASSLGWGDAIGKGGLSAREIEQVSLHVSELNGCGYCVSAHTALGSRVGLTQEEALAARDGRGGNEREQALLSFARRVLRTGGSRAGTELVRLREARVKDGEIVDLIALVALNAFRNAVNIVGETPIDFPKAPRLPS